MWLFEHFSACLRSERQMANFREALAACDLTDIGFEGLPFTYDNNQHGDRNVRVRLDRVAADWAWREIFEAAEVIHLVSARFDHAPLLVKIQRDKRSGPRARCLRYEIMWERDVALPEEIAKAWEKRGEVSNLGDVSVALKNVLHSLKEWSREHFGAVTRQIEELRATLEFLKGQGAQVAVTQVWATIDKLNELLYGEEMMWLQRLRISWMREGDRNTNYFHRKAAWRARKNRIKKLKDEQGRCFTKKGRNAKVSY
uniref:Endonuclease/exonuclease/phosphatase domain-containing protein n=1 Tax=Arundo donax TaxID=35708 RepID=A0A0A9FUR2_ARUDO